MQLKDFLNDNRISYIENVSLQKLTGMNLLGTLPLIAYPESIYQLEILYKWIVNTDFSYEVLGGLTNTYLKENFRRDLVIVTTKVRDINFADNKIVVGCGYGLSSISKKLTRDGYDHFCGLVGIPGTIGAAAINNSGAFGDSMSQVVSSVTIMDNKGIEHELTSLELSFSPRRSKLKFNNFGVVLSVTLYLKKATDCDSLLKKMNSYQELRRKLIDGHRKSLGSIIAGYSLQELWKRHKFANIIRKIIYYPFKYTRFRKQAQCFAEFISLGNIKFIKHCDNLGRFCWTKNTKESDFMEYLSFIKAKSCNKIIIEIEIKS